MSHLLPVSQRPSVWLAGLLMLLFPFALRAQEVHYSPAWFGPNANPVPQFADGTIPARTTLALGGNYYFGFGDLTGNLTFDVEVPLLPECVSLRVWLNTLERYRVTPGVHAERQMTGGLSGWANGDFYVQTRIRILRERRWLPAVVLNSTLKTASGTQFHQRRYFDTPGYYFDVEIAKSFHFRNRVLSEVRGVVDAGFLCWETTGSVQNDAPMYGGKIILANRLFDWENSVSGYYGWMHNGDAPLVYSSKLIFKQPLFRVFAQYQYGIKDFPYHHVQAGVAVELDRLTPKYKLPPTT